MDRRKIAVVGLGYVGLPLALEFAKKNIFVYGIDSDRERVNRLKNKESYITDIPSGILAMLCSRCGSVVRSTQRSNYRDWCGSNGSHQSLSDPDVTGREARVRAVRPRLVLASCGRPIS